MEQFCHFKIQSLHFQLILTLVLVGPVLGQHAPRVTSVFPEAQTISSETNTNILVTFDQAIDTQTVANSTFKIFGRWSGPADGNLQFENNSTRVRFTPNAPFSVGEWVTVSLSKLIRGENGLSLENGYAWNFWIKSAPGTLELQEISRISVRRESEGHIQCYGSYAGDLNDDGWNDLTIINEIPSDIRVFFNEGSGTYSNFTIYGLSGGARPSPSEGADFNLDGFIDFAVGNTQNNKVHFFEGVGDGTFHPNAPSFPADSGVRGLAVIDLNGDGLYDVVTANRNANNISLLMNNGDGTFSTTNIEGGGNGETACAVADANGDGIADLFVGAIHSEELILLLGDGSGGFPMSDKVNAIGNPWMVAVGDVNGDGNVDVVSANSTTNNAALSFGDGLGGLSEVVTYPAGAFPLAIDLGDLDGDGDLDMVTSSFSSGEWYFYENDGNGNFGNPRIRLAASAASCATLHDHDNDGDLDMTGIDELDDLIFIFENDLETGIRQVAEAAENFQLFQNYPNPFNPSTIIEFSIPSSEYVSLKIYDTVGRQVATLVSKTLATGNYKYEWSRPVEIASGVYLYQLKTDSFQKTKKMILVR